jgi:hypothetical protein
MKKHSIQLFSLVIFFFLTVSAQKNDQNSSKLQNVFKEWRSFEIPPIENGAPDYKKITFDKRFSEFLKLKSMLCDIDKSSLSTEEKVDWTLIWAEMNGYLFNYKVLKPWERDPAFYKTIWTSRSDVPAHEGPSHHNLVELWKYKFPLNSEDKLKLISDLKVIPNLNKQAKQNLIGNARDLWITGIRTIKRQSSDLKSLLKRIDPLDKGISKVIIDAINSTNEFVGWLEKEAINKNGPSGIGKENYTWYQKNVHLVPLTWEQEVILLKNELARAWTSLKFEEKNNSKLPYLSTVNNSKEYDELAKKSAEELLTFLNDQKIITVKPYYGDALQPHLGKFIPKYKRNFFWITAHYDPKPLYSHFFHWFELAQMDIDPHKNEIRRKPLLYNIFDSRSEGVATAVEELFMQAGLYKNNPRAREIVYILIAQRAARGLGSLYAHANIMSMEEAGKIHSEYTPRGWMKTEKDLLIFEQHLYLRQPGYGTSYITGKYLLESAIADYSKINEEENSKEIIKDFFDLLMSIGNIPITLAHWQMTNSNAHIKDLINECELNL